MYLDIDIPDIRLIPLDHLTYTNMNITNKTIWSSGKLLFNFLCFFRVNSWNSVTNFTTSNILGTISIFIWHSKVHFCDCHEAPIMSPLGIWGFMLSPHQRSFNDDSIDLYNVLRFSGISRKSAALIVRYSQKKKCISFVFCCFEKLSIAITLEPLVRFRWGFQQNVPLIMRI